MSDLSISLRNYFNGFNELKQWDALTKEEKGKVTLKIVSYATFVIPLIASIIYRCSLAFDTLFDRVSIETPASISETVKVTNDVKTIILKPNFNVDKGSTQNLTSTSQSDEDVEQMEIHPLIKCEFTDINDSDENGIALHDDEYTEKNWQDYLSLEEQNEEVNHTPTSESTPTISHRTKYSRERLAKALSDMKECIYKHKIIETPDNGDCFFGAFAAGISQKQGKEITLQELRQIVSKNVQKIHNADPENNWIKNLLDNDFGGIDSYDDYVKKIGNDFSLSNGAPIWGRENLDGVILCRHFKVNLHVTEMIPYDDMPSSIDDIAIGETTYPAQEKYPDEIKIALYTGHFLGLVP